MSPPTHAHRHTAHFPSFPAVAGARSSSPQIAMRESCTHQLISNMDPTPASKHPGTVLAVVVTAATIVIMYLDGACCTAQTGSLKILMKCFWGDTSESWFPKLWLPTRLLVRYAMPPPYTHPHCLPTYVNLLRLRLLWLQPLLGMHMAVGKIKWKISNSCHSRHNRRIFFIYSLPPSPSSSHNYVGGVRCGGPARQGGKTQRVIVSARLYVVSSTRHCNGFKALSRGAASVTVRPARWYVFAMEHNNTMLMMVMPTTT